MKRWLPWIVCVAIAIAAAVTVLIIVRDSRKLREANDQIEQRLEHYCSDLASELHRAAELLSERSKPLRNTSLTQAELQRTETAFDQALPFGAGTSALIGVESRHGRAVASLAISNQFGFCTGVRKAPKNRIDAVRLTFAESNQRFREQEEREVIAAAVAVMAAAASEVKSWPSLAR